MKGSGFELDSDPGGPRIVSRNPQDDSGVRFVFLVVLALAMPSRGMAQVDIDDPEQSENDIDSPGLVIEASAGWDGTVDRSTPIPFSFLITNHSDRMIEGHLTLTDPMMGHEVQLGEVFIAPGTARRVTSIQAMTEWYECSATLNHRGRILWRRDLPLTTGRAFFPNVNFALFVDDAGRSLQLPGALGGNAVSSTTDQVLAAEQGRPVQCLTVKSWQVPDHPGPLAVAQVMILLEDAADADLNRVQWRAVAEWMCQGGTVFVHSKSREIITRLTEASPLGGAAPVQSGEFSVRHIGLGAIYEYPQPLFDPESTQLRQRVAEITAKLTTGHITTLVNSGNMQGRRGGRADRNRILVVAFFAFYTVLSGLVALFLFRLSQRRIAIYTAAVVVGACVVSGLLGGLLRFSTGDLRWMTITQAGAGGIVQMGMIEVQSAGGRNTQVAIKGNHPDLQLTGRSEPYYYSWNQHQTGYAPFTWQPNLARGEDDAYQVRVPMTPWGSRKLHATAYSQETRRLGFQLQFEPHKPPAGIPPGANPPGDSPPVVGMGEFVVSEMMAVPSGAFSLKLVNNLPFDLTNCWLVVGVSEKSPAQTVVPGQATANGRQLPPIQTVATVGNPIDVYHITHIHNLPAGATYAEAFEADFQVREYWEMNRSWRHGSLTLPRLSRAGTASAWIVGQIEKSPVITIDEQRSDFVAHDELHLFIQEILPPDMPKASAFSPAAKAAVVESSEQTPE